MAAVRSAAHRWPQGHAIKGTILSEESQAADRKTFSDLGVLPSIVDALAQSDIIHPFPIQAMAIPIALTGTDMIGQARTGTGKTLAFGITILQRIVIPGERDFAQLARPGAPQALVVAPTRELALQSVPTLPPRRPNVRRGSSRSTAVWAMTPNLTPSATESRWWWGHLVAFLILPT